MEINSDDEVNIFYEKDYYTQTIKNSNELCIICQLDEHENCQQWDRYKLICGHIFHTRCFRKWAEEKQSINCPYCGNIKQIEKNKFCNSCNSFGHQSCCRLTNEEIEICNLFSLKKIIYGNVIFVILKYF